MASQQLNLPQQRLAVAKTSFMSSLLKRDPVPVPREEIDHWHGYFNDLLEKCSRNHVQTCKRWLVKNVSHSPARVSAFGSYLAAYSTALASLPTPTKKDEEKKANFRAKRLFIVFLVSDFFYHDSSDKSQLGLQTAAVNMKPHLKTLFTAASEVEKRNTSIPKQLHLILDCWKVHQYYSDKYLDRLRSLVDSAGKAEVQFSDDDMEEVVPRIQKAQQHILPPVHGEPSAPWFRQPAGVLYYEMKKTPGRRIDPRRIKPVSCKAGPAPEHLADAMRNFMKEVGKIGKTAGSVNDGDTVLDVDALGKLTLKDEDSNESNQVYSYYGWSEDLTRTIARSKKKERLEDADIKPFKMWDIPKDSGSASGYPSLSHNRRSFSRFDRAGSNDPSRSPRRGSSRDRSRARYSNRPHSKDRSRSSEGRSMTRSRSRSRSRSKSPRRYRRYSRSRSRDRSSSRDSYRGRSKSPDRRGSRGSGREGPYMRTSRPEGFPRERSQDFQGHPRPENWNQRNPLMNQGVPPPPPPPPHTMTMPPPNWQGPWPPPPPPPNMIPGQMPYPPFAGAPPPPPMYGNFNGPPPPGHLNVPPPPPPSQWPQGQGYSQGQGYGNRGGRGYRGGYGGYRGR